MATNAFKVPLEMLVSQLDAIRAKHGEEAYQSAVWDLATSIVLMPNGETFLHNAFPDLDLEEVKRRAALRETDPPASSGNPDQMMLDLLRQQIPSIKTQVQFNTFLTAFDAFRTTLDGYFSGNPERASRARDALNKTLDVAAQVNDVAEKIQEIPEENRSVQSKEFLTEPKEFHEYDIQRKLLVQLSGIETMADLGEWYTNTKSDRDSVVSQTLRNELIDKIRSRRLELQAMEAN